MTINYTNKAVAIHHFLVCRYKFDGARFITDEAIQKVIGLTNNSSNYTVVSLEYILVYIMNITVLRKYQILTGQHVMASHKSCKETNCC